MLLSPSIYANELSRKTSVSCFLDEKDEICLKMPMLYIGQPLERDRVYVGNLAQLENLSVGCNCLFICSGEPGEKRPVGINADLIIAHCDLATLFNFVLGIYEKYQQWEKGNNDILTSGDRIVQKLLDLAASVHNNMFHILDANFVTSVLSFQGVPRERFATAEALRDTVGQPLAMEDFHKLQNEFSKVSQKRRAQHHCQSQIETLDIPMHRGDLYLGMLSMVQYNRAFEKSDYAIVELLSPYVEYAIAIESQQLDYSSDIANLTSAFSQILASKHVSKKTITRLFDAVGFGKDDSFVIVSVRPKEHTAAKYWEYVCNSLVNIVDKAVVCSSKSSYSILINTTVNPKREQWMARLDAFMKHYDMLACVSDEFTNFQYCEPYYNSVVDTLFSFPLDLPSGVYLFSDYRMNLVLSNSCGKLMPQIMYCDAFRRLLAYEKSSNVSYLETLRVLLEENMNMSSAAKRLYISRNSLLARCERLYRVLEVDIEDARIRFELQYSLYLHDYFNSYR